VGEAWWPTIRRHISALLKAWGRRILRFFGGLSLEATGHVLQISMRRSNVNGKPGAPGCIHA
jgi:hypothetical protein